MRTCKRCGRTNGPGGCEASIPDGGRLSVARMRDCAESIAAALATVTAERDAAVKRAEDAEANALPMVATDAMTDGLPRQVVMWMSFDRPAGHALYEHLRCGGPDAPEWLRHTLRDTEFVAPKAHRAEILWRAMAEEWKKETANEAR